MEKKLRELPKIELHCHLDGSVRPETMKELYRAKGKYEDIRDEEFKSMVSIEGQCDSLKEYLERFSYPLEIMQDEASIYRVTYELLEDLSKQNVKYVEIRFAPYLHMANGLSFDQVVDGVVRAMDKGQEDFGIMARGILIAMRHEPSENSIALVKNGEKFLNKGIVGVDLAGNEHDFPPEIHEEAFKLARKMGYHITIHGGETGIVENIEKSIKLLNAERIGHGIAARKDKSTRDLIKENNIYLEMCPISNIQTNAVANISEYPIGDFLKEDILVTVNTDNITVSNTSLEDEYRFLVEKVGLSLEDIKKTIRNAVEASFLDEEDKAKLRAIVESEL